MIFYTEYDEKKKVWFVVSSIDRLCQAVSFSVAYETAMLMTEFRRNNP